MIGHKRIPSREGGIEIVVEELASRMVAAGHHVTVYNRAGKHVAGVEKQDDILKQKVYKGIRIITIPTPSSKSLNAVVYSLLATLHASFGRYDVIHYHAEGPCSMIWIPRLFGINTVATIHGLDWQRAKWGGFATKFLLFGEKCAARYAKHLIVLTKSLQSYFTSTYQRKTVHIPNGIEILERIPPKIITEKYGLHDEEYILFLARIVPEKGLHYLIEAYETMNTVKKLVIAGGSSHTDEYMDTIKKSISGNDKIIMTGFVQGKELAELFSNCSVYVLPSDVEGMPLSLLEALSYGCRCLISDIPENVETAGGLANTFSKGNVWELRNALESMLRKDSSETERACISGKVKELYNWDDITEATLRTYQQKSKDR